MFGFDPLVISSAFVLAASSNNPCKMPQPTKINVIPATDKVQLITNKTLAQLQETQTDTINPYGYGAKTFTQGFARGRISMRTEVKLDHSILKRRGAACIWYDEINVKFDIDPDVFIAKEVYADKCMRKAVVGHEMKHVMTDRKVVNKYSRIIGQKLYSELKSRGFISAPVYIEEAQSMADRMQRTVAQIIELEQKRMDLDRQDMQGQVDSLGEYERVDAMCPDWKVTEEMLNPTSASSGRRRR